MRALVYHGGAGGAEGGTLATLHDCIYDLETQDSSALGLPNTRVITLCGFNGSWEDCMNHEQGCTYDGQLTIAIQQSMLEV